MKRGDLGPDDLFVQPMHDRGVATKIVQKGLSGLFDAFPFEVAHPDGTFPHLFGLGRKQMGLEFMDHLEFMLKIS